MHKTIFNKRLKTVKEQLPAWINEYPVPGLAVGIIHRGELVFSENYGFADLKKETEISSETIFRIMSISKTFTSIAAMQLWEQGKFDLDDPINPHLKGLRVQHDDLNAPQVTFRHLMTHTSGIGETRDLKDLTLNIGGLAGRSDSRILPMREYYNRRLKPEIYPAMKWAYANHAFATLAQLIEDISGQPFAEYMREHVFEPLDMQHSEYYMSERVRDELAQGYMLKNGAFEEVEYTRLNTPGCGGIFSSVNDMVKYTAALMNGGANKHGRVLQPETLEMMMTSQIGSIIDERIFKMGLGFFLEDMGGNLIAEHGGGWPGFISSMRVVPEQDIAVLVFTNSSSQAPSVIGDAITRKLLDVADPLENMPDNTVPERPADWPSLCGHYTCLPGILTNSRPLQSVGSEVEIYVKENKLMLRGLIGPLGKGVQISRKDADDSLLYQGQFMKMPFTVLFQIDEEGHIDRLQSSALKATMYKQPLQTSHRGKLYAVAGVLGGLAMFGIGKLLLKGNVKCNK